MKGHILIVEDEHAHPLKSLSSIMGVVALSEIAKTIEDETKNAIKNGEDITHLQELVPLMEESLKYIKPKLRDMRWHHS